MRAITAAPAINGGILLDAVTIAQPLSAVDRIAVGYNLDGVVDDADRELWIATFGSTVDLRADGNGNGVFDAADFAVWRDNLGTGAGDLLSVPEPDSMTVFALAILFGLLRRRESI